MGQGTQMFPMQQRRPHGKRLPCIVQGQEFKRKQRPLAVWGVERYYRKKTEVTARSLAGEDPEFGGVIRTGRDAGYTNCKP